MWSTPRAVETGVNVDWTLMWRGMLEPITHEAMQNLTFRENIFSCKFESFSFSEMDFTDGTHF